MCINRSPGTKASKSTILGTTAVTAVVETTASDVVVNATTPEYNTAVYERSGIMYYVHVLVPEECT